MKHRKLVGTIALVGAAAFAGSSQAAVYGYVFGEQVSGGAGYPQNMPIADLTIKTGSDALADGAAAGEWIFRLNNIDLAAFGDSSFFGAIAVATSDKNVQVTSTNASSGIDAVTIKNGSAPGGSAKFRFEFGNGSSASQRMIGGEWAEWTASGLTSVTAYFAHIQGITLGEGSGSAWYSATPPAPVPVPAAFWLVGSALLGFLGLKRYIEIKNTCNEGQVAHA